MPNLHAYYYHGNVKAFRAEIDPSSSGSGTGSGNNHSGGGGGGGSGSAGRSWTMSNLGMMNDQRRGDPNERDGFGRT
jgi:hypothetical protein